MIVSDLQEVAAPHWPSQRSKFSGGRTTPGGFQGGLTSVFPQCACTAAVFEKGIFRTLLLCQWQLAVTMARRHAVVLACALAAIALVSSANAASFTESFDSSFKERWTHSSAEKYNGQFAAEAPKGLSDVALKVRPL